MRKLKIHGLVKNADLIRRELSSPLGEERKERVRRRAERLVREVDAILAQHDAQVAHLPAPTRRAYEFLRNLDVDTTQAASAVDPTPSGHGTVTLTGLKAYWDGILDQLAQPIGAEAAEIVFNSIASSSKSIEQFIQAKQLTSGDLTTLSRTARGWLAFFADRTNFDAYLAAVARGQPILEASLRRHAPRFHPPARLQFRPLTSLYRVRGHQNETRFVLPTAMISFSDGLYEALALAIFDGGSKQPIMDAATEEVYQSMQAELEARCGVEARPAGAHHDLAASFDRVNRRYFSGELSRPRLTWSLTFTGRKFGHYDPVRDTVMVSSTLDQANVPALVVDFIMYHELLHKQLGIDWRNGRRHAHTAEFKAAEQRFERAADATAILTRLASGTGYIAAE